MAIAIPPSSPSSQSPSPQPPHSRTAMCSARTSAKACFGKCCPPTRRCAATTCIVVCSTLVHILGIAATCFAPARPIVWTLPPLLVVSLILTTYLFFFAPPSAYNRGNARKQPPSPSQSPGSGTASPVRSGPTGARVFGIDPETIATQRSGSYSPTSATRRRTSGSAGGPNRPPAPETSDSLGSLLDALDHMHVSAPGTTSSTQNLLPDPTRSGSAAATALPPTHQHIPSLGQAPRTRPWYRSWRHILCLVLNPLIMLMWLVLLIYIVFFPYWFRNVDKVTFVRLGHVTDTSCHVAFRTPGTSKVAVQFRPLDVNPPASWTTTSPPMDVSAAGSDALGNVELTGLAPNTRYEYYLVDGQLGTRLAGDPILGGSFKTNYAVADARKAKASVAFGSCIKRDTPFFSESGIRGFRDLANRPELQSVDQMLFFGDWVYVDVPWFYKDSVEAFRWHYKNVMDVKEAREVSRRVNMYFTYDDHEISNNWNKGTSPPFPNANSVFSEYLAVTNPKPAAPDTVYFNHTTPPACFFFMDTRRYRTQPNTPTSSMLGADQLAYLKRWLTDPQPGCNWRFLVSSVPMTINWSIDDDTWYGFRNERRDLLHYIRDQGVKNVIVLSGDRHDVAAQRMDENRDVVEVSVSPVTNFHSPISVYRKDNGDEVLFKPPIGPVAVGVVEVEWEKVKFKVWDGSKISWEYEIVAK
ncbi:PhoD-like phosphatase-domain-containing protein [Catenaria anguillulae PL171]|uniref:PhoD-like phosphatase-domain-containing protein n=1 Tax=Catenaria anguillulae PL171 TaxID=765915 RepID=A0A1Y2HHS8_9FUNG|nr:PhoD-like phosphatase-domain-containing protein [Catenaria anguillulae PL171]